ncbi:MAG: hypothetical protein K2L81_06070 [Muribaculaceae bacterium]|nr:hypothetical protein [Muribaculaceae bacterium]
MRRLIIILLLTPLTLLAKGVGDFDLHFYGIIRSDLFYNSRDNVETVDGLFYMYPKDHNYDPLGNDLNDTPQGSFHSIYTRLGVDINGPRLGSAATSAKVEIDFRGSGSNYAMPRIRQAYFNLDWGRWALLVGQTWHPLFGEVSPSVLNLSTGAPFQPFNRSPQVRGRFTRNRWQLTASAIWQSQFNSIGPAGKSSRYIKYSNIPELYIGADYRHGPWTAGIGGEMLSLKPRTEATIDDVTYKVNARVTSLSAEAHIKYRGPLWMASAKTTLANNLTHTSMLGGFGVIETDPTNHQCRYTPFHHSMTWVNLVYGKRWQPGIFAGYLKNLGTSHPITGQTYGEGLDIDQLLGVSAQISYNPDHWRFGVEVSTSTAWYGTLRPSDGRVVDTHSVTNLRVAATAQFIF